MPQRKGRTRHGWLGGEVREDLRKIIHEYTRTGIRPDGPIPGMGSVELPNELITDYRLPPYAVHVYATMLGFSHPHEDGVPWASVHDRVIEAIIGKRRPVVRYARQRLEKYGYIRRIELASDTAPPRSGYELIASKGTDYGDISKRESMLIHDTT